MTGSRGGGAGGGRALRRSSSSARMAAILAAAALPPHGRDVSGLSAASLQCPPCLCPATSACRPSQPAGPDPQAGAVRLVPSSPFPTSTATTLLSCFIPLQGRSGSRPPGRGSCLRAGAQTASTLRPPVPLHPSPPSNSNPPAPALCSIPLPPTADEPHHWPASSLK